MNEFWNNLSQQLKPRFHEITLYLIALAFCWLIYFHPELRLGYFLFLTGFESMSPLFVALGLIVTGGLVLSLIHVFIKRKKLAFEKAIMGWSVLGLSGVTSFFVESEMLTSRQSIMVILVVWNILMSVLLLFQMGLQKYVVSDENASFIEVCITTAIHLHLSWATTLSLCIFYSTFIVFVTTLTINYFGLQIPYILKQ
jgi:hypothetical protein